MSWKDKHGNPVFRRSPDEAWPLRRDSDAAPRKAEGFEAEGQQLRPNPRLKVVR